MGQHSPGGCGKREQQDDCFYRTVSTGSWGGEIEKGVQPVWL